ncbi:AlpA family phage regulatory protein [Pararhizobium sp. YC-54]|uniref:helix-turn-helix transcriptional regulator n=1 Tax=Pararhizobium sp. YC-54 TaxID=2986920 RepID=UPI0021F6B07E|nr:AlpA family phage regulatory protein [Pararhizobium sp. YC-54]MCV9997667.1 AlpA family phage regulatory protein [Pararhizobium sp. YC-54]
MQTENTPTLLSIKDVCALTSLSRTGINKARAIGRFPQAVEIHGRRIAFVRAEVLDWINSRIAARDGAAQ